MSEAAEGGEIRYRKLSSYKYQLWESYNRHIDLRPEQDIDTPYVALSGDGRLTVKQSYAWDGPSGPAIDTKTFLRASLVHDALYQMMREELLDHRVHRKRADDLLKTMCLEDGMFVFRAWYAHLALRLFGGRNARPGKKARSKIFTAP